MAITVKEKEHWKERIGRRIDQAIEELESKENPEFRSQVKQAAEDAAWESLGLKDHRGRYKQLGEQIDKLKEQQTDLAKEMMVRIGCREQPLSYGNDVPFAVQNCVKKRSSVHEKEILAGSELGQKILHLQREKDELLDTVWLATSSSQIKQLWSGFAELLSWEPPALQKQALTIEPVPSDE